MPVGDPQWINPLEQLIIVAGPAPIELGPGQDRVEALDAVHEDGNGRLPHEPGYQIQGQEHDVYDHTEYARRYDVQPGAIPALTGDTPPPAPEPAPAPAPAPKRSASGTRTQPTRAEMTRRRETLLAAVRQEPRSAMQLADTCAVPISGIYRLINQLRDEGELHSAGNGQWMAAEPRDAPPAEPTVFPPPDVRERYITLVAQRRPERLIELLDSHRIPMTDEILEMVERAIFDAPETDGLA